jgi:hypothetical protein
MSCFVVSSVIVSSEILIDSENVLENMRTNISSAEYSIIQREKAPEESFQKTELT